MKRYPKYKDSGVPWLGKVPAHWELLRFKNLFCEMHLRRGYELPAGSISYGKVVFKDDQDVHGPTKESYQAVLGGDFLINPINLNYDLKSLRTALSEIDVCVSPAYIVLKASRRESPHYLRHLLYAFDLHHMKTLGSGVRHTITFDDIGSCVAVAPPISEQEAIASFLGRQLSQIDSAISSQEHMIELLKERRSAIITQAVTKGLNPKAKMKDSGVPWLGQVPEHWELRRVKNLAAIINGHPFDSKLFGSDGHELIRIRDISSSQTETRYAGSWVESAEVNNGDVLIGMDGDFNVSAWRGQRALLNQRVCCLRGSDADMTSFLRWAIVRPLKLLNDVTYSTTVKHLSSKDLLNLAVAVPSHSEIRAICSYINKVDDGIAEAISSQERMIELLKERRSAIITQAVTGQIDVR